MYCCKKQLSIVLLPPTVGCKKQKKKEIKKKIADSLQGKKGVGCLMPSGTSSRETP